MASELRRSNRIPMTSDRKLMTPEELEWRVQWNDEDCLKLIQLYREKPELWNRDDRSYTYRLPKLEAWKSISSYFGCKIDEVKLKIFSLRKKYMEERCREASPTETYKSNWFAYDSFHFLRNIKNGRRYSSSSDSDSEKISQNGVKSNTNDINMNSIRDGHTSKHSGTQLNQFSSARKSARKRTTTHRNSSSLDESNIHNNAVVSVLVHDECSTFADHVKIKLEKFGPQDRAILMHKVNNIIFEAEMKKYGRRDFDVECVDSIRVGSRD